jgi:hypothetical protein
MKGKKTELKFEEGMGGSIEMRVSRATWGACPPLIQYNLPFALQRQESVSFWECQQFAGQATSTAAGEFPRWKRNYLTVSEETLS